MEYYKKYLERYMNADSNLRRQAKEHWTIVHAQNLESGRDDLIVFSAKMLASITLADYLSEKVPTA